MSVSLNNAQHIIDFANKEELYTLGLQGLLQNAEVIMGADGLLIIKTTTPCDKYEMETGVLWDLVPDWGF